MATRYTIDDLLHLKQSPLCIKPASLPPPDEWMGPPVSADTPRAQPKTMDNRSRLHETSLLDQGNRRTGVDRARTSANPEDIILGPPRTTFLSSSMRNNTSHRLGDNDTAPDNDLRDRFNFRSRPDGANDDRGDRLRDGRSGNYRSRRDVEQESEGWTAVKPRKSFGHDGAERFQRSGMGDRFGNRDDTRRQRDDTDVTRDRTRHHGLSRDKDGDDPDQPRRNGMNRNRSEPWFVKDHNAGNDRNAEDRPSQRERIDRAKSWRDKNETIEERSDYRTRDRNNDRTNNRGWGDRSDRDNRGRDSYKGAEHDPEWMDEPADEKVGGRTEMDLKNFLESMKKANAPKNDDQPATAAADGPPTSSFFEPETKTKAPESAPAVDPAAPDRFFETFGPVTSKVAEDAKNSKSSRFTSFFTSQQEGRQTEPPTPVVAAPVQQPVQQPAQPPQNGVGALFGQAQQPSDNPQQEREAFQALLQKLQKQTLQSSGTPPNANPPEPPPPQQQDTHKSNTVSSEAFQQYGRPQGDEPAQFRGVPQSMLDSMLAQRPASNAPSQPPSTRPEQMLQHLTGHRQQAPSQGSNRMEPTPGPAVNPQTEFLMGLMRGHQAAPEPRRTEEMMAVRMPQPQKQVSLPSVRDREIELEMRERERYQQQQAQHMQQLQQQQQQAPQQQYAMQHQLQQPGPQQQGQAQQLQQMRANPQRAPSMAFEEQFRRPEQDNRLPQQQPTAILQRPPPGLDHQMHPGFMNPGPNAQLPPPQRGPMIPPPGLMNQPNRPMPGMFPPPGAFPPQGAFPGPGPGPDGMGGPPRSMQPPPPPPPGFFNGPPPPGPPGPPGFMPPMPGMGFPPPDGVGFPFDARGMPPPGAPFRRP